MSSRPFTRGVVQRARGMAMRGHAPDDIASTLSIDPGDVARILDRRVHGRLGGLVRSRHLAGESAEVIAAALAVPLYRVREFIARLTPRLQGRGATLRRPRSRAAQARPPRPRRVEPYVRPLVRSEWSLLRGPEYRDDDGGPLPAIAAAEGPLSAEPRDESPADGQGVDQLVPPATSAAADPWGSLYDCGRSGGASGNAALGDAEADRIRALRAAGIPRKDVAKMFNVSVATITRITRGETYRPDAREPRYQVFDQVVTIERPAIAAADPVRWDPADDG